MDTTDHMYTDLLLQEACLEHSGATLGKRCKMCMCWECQRRKQSRCRWLTQRRHISDLGNQGDCLEEALPKPGPNLAREK